MAKTATNQAWKFVGGRLCLDFINTVGGRARDGKRDAILREKLVDYGALLDWSRWGGGVNSKQARRLGDQAALHGRQAGAILARAVALREAMYRIFRYSLQGRRPAQADLDTLTRELRLAQARRRLRRCGRAFEWRWESEGALDRVLWPVSWSAAEVLASGDLSRIRQCTGNDCGWLFLDTSRNGRRRWCDMQDCGNRAKVRRFRERQQRARRGPGAKRPSAPPGNTMVISR